MKNYRLRSRIQRFTAVGTRFAYQATPPYPQKLALTSPTTVGHSADVVCLQTKRPRSFFLLFIIIVMITIIIIVIVLEKWSRRGNI
jgi:hypothetical protein